MADFTALKTAIQTYIKQNGNEEITGAILQEILLSVVTTLGDSAINDLVTALGNEVTARQNADATLQNNIDGEATTRGNADTALQTAINDEARIRANADGTLQGAINGITAMIENGYVYAGIATPSTTPATGKVFYLALTAGTYTNFGSTEVSQGINILKYNGSAWSLDAFIGIDDTPTPNSPKLVKSGGAFESVMANGSAFDISAHFASGGTLATYADLSAALTALDTLSASYKRGGMSIKFVQSSDNKYIQARLMANEFTTDATKWQGVDEKPTPVSKNVVESGGVAEDFININDVLGRNEDVLFAKGKTSATYLPNTLPSYVLCNIKLNTTTANSWTRLYFCKTEDYTSDSIQIIQKKELINIDTNFYTPSNEEYPYIYIQNPNNNNCVITSKEEFGLTRSAKSQGTINVNVFANNNSTYSTKASARGDIAQSSGLRRKGLKLTYNLLDVGWITEQFIGNDVTGTNWTSTEDNWLEIANTSVQTYVDTTATKKATALTVQGEPYLFKDIELSQRVDKTNINAGNIGAEIFRIGKIKNAYISNPIPSGVSCNIKLNTTTGNSWTRVIFCKTEDFTTNAIIVVQVKKITNINQNFISPLTEEYPYLYLQNLNNNEISVTLNEEIGLAKRISDINENVDGDDLDTFAKKVYDAVDGDCTVFVHCTDTHSGFSSMPLSLAAKHLQKISKIAEKVNADFIIHTGDAIHGYDENANNAFDSYRALLSKYNYAVPLIFAEGNYVHDFGYSGEINRNQVQTLFGKSKKWLEQIAHYNTSDIDSYFYFDLKGVRYIVLDAQDAGTNRREYGFSSEQQAFITTTLNGALTANLPVVIFAHMAPTSNLFQPDKSYGMDWRGGSDMINILASFTSNGGLILAYIHGHQHWDNYYYDSEHAIPYVCMLNEYPRRESFNAPVWGTPVVYDRSLADNTQYAVDVYVIKKSTGTGSILRFGAGLDRSISRT